MAASSLFRRYSRTSVDLEPFRAELDTNGFRSQLTAVGSQELIRKLVFAGSHVTRVVWVRSERPLCACGNPLTRDEDICPACCPMPSESEQIAKAEREAA